jgi:hypothetical protein
MAVARGCFFRAQTECLSGQDRIILFGLSKLDPGVACRCLLPLVGSR